EFEGLGLKLGDGNYFKVISYRNISIEKIISETTFIFVNIYGIDMSNYEIETNVYENVETDVVYQEDKLSSIQKSWVIGIIVVIIFIIFVFLSNSDPKKERERYIQEQKKIYQHEKQNREVKQYFELLKEQAKQEVDNESSR
ncbi:MAG: hypothetical protein GXO89_00120, partial [Chlorobi bacterium]|nr:hypothetical protein [Chlorobiota bacterium]